MWVRNGYKRKRNGKGEEEEQGIVYPVRQVYLT